MRKIIADNMHASLQNAAQLTVFVECDVTDMVAMREQALARHAGEEGYRREFTVPDALVQKYLRKKRVGGEEVCVLPIRFSGLDGQQSVRICEFIYIYAAEK